VLDRFLRWQKTAASKSAPKEEENQKQQEQDRVALEQLGGKELAIQNFYASPGEIRRGESVQLCYARSQRKTVKLGTSKRNPVWPSYSRCVEVTPPNHLPTRLPSPMLPAHPYPRAST